MDSHTLLKSLLRSPPSLRTLAIRQHLPQPQITQHQQCRALSAPRILSPSFWTSMIPKPLRPASLPDSPPSAPRKPWNPATPYIVLGLLVGSQAIQTLWLKQERAHAARRADAKIGVLKEVLGRVQRGEEVDVEGVLGSGDAVREGEWDEVIKEIENEEPLFQSRKKRKALKQAAEEKAAQEQAQASQETQQQESKQSEAGSDHVAPKIKVESLNGAKFY